MQPINDDILQQIVEDSDPERDEVSGTKRMLALGLLLLIVAAAGSIFGGVLVLLSRYHQ